MWILDVWKSVWWWSGLPVTFIVLLELLCLFPLWKFAYGSHPNCLLTFCDGLGCRREREEWFSVVVDPSATVTDVQTGVPLQLPRVPELDTRAALSPTGYGAGLATKPVWTLWRQQSRLLLMGIECRFLDNADHNLVALLTELSQLLRFSSEGINLWQGNVTTVVLLGKRNPASYRPAFDTRRAVVFMINFQVTKVVLSGKWYVVW
jgi:hypothetical protein